MAAAPHRDILTHYLRIVSPDEYRELIRNYVIRDIAERTVPEHRVRMAQLQQEWLCDWRDHMSADDPKRLIVSAPDRPTAFAALVRRDLEYFREIIRYATSIDQVYTFDRSDDELRTLFSQLKTADVEDDMPQFLRLLRNPAAETVFQGAEINISNKYNRGYEPSHEITLLSTIPRARAL